MNNDISGMMMASLTSADLLLTFFFFTDAIVIMQIMCSISPCKLLTIDTESYRWSDRF